MVRRQDLDVHVPASSTHSYSNLLSVDQVEVCEGPRDRNSDTRSGCANRGLAVDVHQAVLRVERERTTSQTIEWSLPNGLALVHALARGLRLEAAASPLWRGSRGRVNLQDRPEIVYWARQWTRKLQGLQDGLNDSFQVLNSSVVCSSASQ